MAGEGQRFRDKGFELPKPLLPVNGIPMVIQAVLDLPKASRYIFLVRSEHIEKYSIDKVIHKYFPTASIARVDTLTDGQASTVRLGEKYLDPHKPVLVAACDSTHIYDEGVHNQLIENGADCLLWSFRNDSRVLLNPYAYGWIQHKKKKVIEVLCKTPISDNITHDYALSGFFTFKTAKLMIHYIDMMIKNNTRVNGEFYMDIVPNFMVKNKLDVRVFEVEKYIGWGTPKDYYDYLRLERYFASTK
jgi:NDP-sugar pyrophosphorylase family protein